MTLTLTLSPERETWIEAQAQAAGVSPEEYALRVLDGTAGPRPVAADGSEGMERGRNGSGRCAPTVSPTMALFAQWAAEDATDDPEEIARRQRLNDETAEQLRRNRFSLEGRTDFRRLASEQDGGQGGEAAA